MCSYIDISCPSSCHTLNPWPLSITQYIICYPLLKLTYDPKPALTRTRWYYLTGKYSNKAELCVFPSTESDWVAPYPGMPINRSSVSDFISSELNPGQHLVLATHQSKVNLFLNYTILPKLVEWWRKWLLKMAWLRG